MLPVFPSVTIDSVESARRAPERSGAGAVIGDIAEGAWHHLTHNFTQVATSAVIGVLAGAAIAVASPVVAIGLGVVGALYAGAVLGKAWDAGKLILNGGGTAEERARAHAELRGFGAGAVDVAAGALGGGFLYSSLIKGAISKVGGTVVKEAVASEASTAAAGAARTGVRTARGATEATPVTIVTRDGITKGDVHDVGSAIAAAIRRAAGNEPRLGPLPAPTPVPAAAPEIQIVTRSGVTRGDTSDVGSAIAAAIRRAAGNEPRIGPAS